MTITNVNFDDDAIKALAARLDGAIASLGGRAGDEST
jgi:hypothetical protein